jgi:HK97 family phage major capsid protein
MGEYDLLIRQRKEEALKALQAARSIKTELADAVVWPADKTEAFNAAMADFQKFHSEAASLETRQSSLAVLDEQHAAYTTPVTAIAHQGPDGPGETATALAQRMHREAYGKYIRHGEGALLPAERHALLTTVDELGGALVPDYDFNELIRLISGFSVMRRLCRVRQTQRQTGTFMTVAAGAQPSYATGLAGSWKPEGWVVGGNNLPTQDQPRFGRERVPTHIWSPDVIEITTDLLEDAVIDLEAELRQILAETKALDEDWAFLRGTGVGMPQGLMTMPGITTIPTGLASGLNYSGIVNLFTGLPAQYRSRSTWLMSSFTYGQVLLIADDQNRPLFPVNALVNQLFGRPIEISEWMASGNVGGNDAVIFGDFSYYAIVDRRDMRIQRLTERFAPNVGILATARTGGQALRSEPFRIGRVGAA